MTKKIFIIAGEASGDILGSKIIKNLNELSQEEINFVGVGGPQMANFGFKSIFEMSELSLMGFFEVLPHIPRLIKRINQTAKAIIQEQPDAIITIDSPDFCFRVIKKLEKLKPNHNIKKIHLIAPSVWAYRPGRAKKVAQIYDLLLTILPFEPPYFEKHGLKSIFVGHPIIEDSKIENEVDIKQKYNIPQDKLLLVITPGSRLGEVNRIFDIFIESANQIAKNHPNLFIILPTIPKVRDLVAQKAQKLKLPHQIIEERNEKLCTFKQANFGLAKSGTNTLEMSIFGLPIIVAYKANPLTAFLVRLMIKIKYGNLVNILLNKEVIKEQIQEECQSDLITNELEKLMSDPNMAKEQQDQCKIAIDMLGKEPSKKMAQTILNNI